MERWETITRRQRLWILDRQRERVLELMSEHGSDAVAATLAIARSRLTPFSLSTAPLSPEQCTRLEKVYHLRAGHIQPFGELPSDDLLPALDGPLTVADPTREGSALPSERAAVARASTAAAMAASGASMQHLLRATGMTASTLRRLLTSTRPSAFRADQALSLARAFGLPAWLFGTQDEPTETPPATRSPALVFDPLPDGRIRIAISARMTRARADAVRTACLLPPTRHAGRADEPVDVRIDTTVHPAAAYRALREVSRPRRKGIHFLGRGSRA